MKSTVVFIARLRWRLRKNEPRDGALQIRFVNTLYELYGMKFIYGDMSSRILMYAIIYSGQYGVDVESCIGIGIEGGFQRCGSCGFIHA